MVHVEPGDGEAGAAHGDDQRDHSGQFVPGHADNNKEQRFAAEAAAVEDFPNVGGAEDLVATQVVG